MIGFLARALLTCLIVAAPARATPAELLDLLERLKVESKEVRADHIAALHESYLNGTADKDKRLTSLALGVHYLDTNARLAMQYLSSAELATKDDDPLRPVVRYYVGQAKFRAGAYAESAKLAEELLARDLGDAWKRRVYGLLIESRFYGGDYAALSDVFQDFTKQFSVSRRHEHLAKLAVQAFEKRGDRKQAIEILEELARSYPTTEASRWAFMRLEDLACEQGGQRPAYYYSERLLQAVSRNVVLDSGLKDFIVAAVERPLADEKGVVRTLALSEKADFFFRARFYDQALKYTEELYEQERRETDSKVLPNVMFELGRIHMRLGEYMLATRHFSKFLLSYPTHPWTTRAAENMGDAFRYLGMPLAAAANYSAGSSGRDSRIVRWQHFWNLMRGRDFTGALTLLDTPNYVEPRDGDEPETLAYWHGRVLEKLGREPEAKVKFGSILQSAGDSYYAQVIAHQYPDLAEEVRSPEVVKAETKGMSLAARMFAPPGDGAAPVPLKPEVKLVDDLLKVGMRDTAKVQLSSLKWSQYTHQDVFASVARLAMVLDDYQPSRRIRFSPFSPLREMPGNWRELQVHQERFSDVWKVYYPLAFEKIVRSVADRTRVDPLLILSVMRAESFYNKDARSGVGASGLMQIMPYTALKIANILGDHEFEVPDLATPETSISYGGYYLDKLVRYYDGNFFLAVASYNAGPMVVNQWIDSCVGCDTSEFVDAIPFRETRRYVREVIRNYAQYLRIYNGKTTISDIPPMPNELPDGEELF